MRKLPRVLFDYVDGAAEDESTAADNVRAFTEVSLLTRAATNITSPKLSTTVLGQPLSMPLILSPCGGVRLMHPDGDRAATRAAGTAGVAFAISTGTRTAPEDVIDASSGAMWFQLYFRGGRDYTLELINRVQAIGFSALFVTVDVAGWGGHIERLFRHRRTFPIEKSFRHALHYAPQLVRHPRWTMRFIGDGLPTDFTEFQRTRSPSNTSQGVPSRLPPTYTQRREDPGVGRPTWEDIDWIREAWKGPLVIKGILTPDDARIARDHGADGIVVSNHGGRQLDTAPSTLRVLPGIFAAVRGELEVLLDGGVRRGSDVVKAIALGANACMIGRPYMYGLAAAGQAGVERVLEIFRSDLVRALAQMGAESIQDIGPESVETSRFTAVGEK